MKIIKLLTFVFFLIMTLSGCNNDGTKDSGMALLKTTNPTPTVITKETKKELDIVHSVEKDIENFKELYDVAVVKSDKDVLVAYKVKHLQRFHMKRIEKKMTKMLHDKYPKLNFTVSSDYKIFLEAVELHESLKNPNYSKKKAKERMERIIKLKNELT